MQGEEPAAAPGNPRHEDGGYPAPLLSSHPLLAFFEANTAVMLLVDPVPGRILDANEAAAAFYGYPRQQFKGMDLGTLNMLTPDRIQEERLLAVEERRNGFIFPHRLSSGEVRTVEVYSTPILDSQTVMLLSIVHDITERTRSEKALFASEAKFTKTFHGSPMPMALSEIHTGCLLDFNAAFVALFGFTHEDMISRTMPELGMVTQATRDAIHAGIAEHGFIHELMIEMTGRNGHALTGLVSAETLTVGNRIRLLSIWQDITERRRAEMEIQRLNNLMKQSQAITMVGGWEIDLVHDTLFWTEETFRIHELDPATFTPTVAKAIDFYAPESLPLIQEAVRAAISDNQGFDLELELITAKGRRIWVHSTGRPVQEGGRTIGVVGAFQEITQNKVEEMEKHLLLNQVTQAQKMESLGSLAGGIAHDMNNVLGAILALASVNLSLHPADSPAYQAFETIAEAATRGGKMVKGLLNFARKTPAEVRAFDPNTSVREVITLLAHTTLSRIGLHTDLEPGLWPILGDASALTHTLMNLCVNAVDAMEEEGTLTLRTRNLAEGWVEVSVEDTGSGMTREVLDRATEPFFTTKETGKGTGLGLSSAYSMVQAHQGQMTLQSEPGQGTCVTLRFPKGLTEIPRTEAKAGPEPRSTRSALNLLLADDDELILRTTRTLLEVLGHTVTAVASGEEAIQQLEAGLVPDVLILDLNMPGLGGARTLPRVRATHPVLPILLATGRTDQTALDLVEAYPRVTLLAKPFNMGDLQDQLLAISGRG